MKEEHLDKVAILHLDVLNDTVNSAFGMEYIKMLYGSVVSSRCSFGFVFIEDSELSGFVTGTEDIHKLNRELMYNITYQMKLKILWRLLISPKLFIKFIISFFIRSPVNHNDVRIKATLLTIGVDPQCRNQGIGRALFEVFVHELERRDITYFQLDTKNDNVEANSFYKKVEPKLIKSKFDSNIYVFENQGKGG